MNEKIAFKYLELAKELLTKVTPELIGTKPIDRLSETVLELAEKLQRGNTSTKSH